MKQKNLILIAVAVGCGLVAAFLTTQLGAGQKKLDDAIEVPVAAKDLPVGTKLAKDDLKSLITYKKVSKEFLPTEFAQSEEQLADKRLVRMVRAGETFNPQDLTTNSPISPPPGYNVMTFAANPEKSVAGFAGPGSKVDVLASIPMRNSKNNRAVVLPVLIDMLVLAIDVNTEYSKQGAFPNMSMVSLAVNTRQASILHATISRGADIRLVLRNADHPPVWDKIYTDEEIWAILADEEKKPSGTDPTGDKEKSTTVKLPVAAEDLKAGTQLTIEVIQKKFKMVDAVAPAPAAFVQNMNEHVGKYLQRDLQSEQFLPKSFVGDQPPSGKPAPSDMAPSKEGPTETPKPATPERPPVYFDTTITTPNGVRKYRYQIMEDGTYKFLGELKDDGTVKPVPESERPGAVPLPGKPAEDKKGGRVIRS
jgi:Flp pilus assembly protein CpaB